VIKGGKELIELINKKMKRQLAASKAPGLSLAPGFRASPLP
jgi:hypothetical protein